jgi:uncharacterized repeat protein (TIGR01451 family)
MKKKLIALLLVVAMVLSIAPSVSAESASIAVQITPSVTDVDVGDTVEYTVTATGQGISALEFTVAPPPGMTYVEGSAKVAQNLKDVLGWAAA